MMRRPLSWLLIAWVTAGAAGQPPNQEEPQPATSAITIAGQVFDHVGAGVDGMTVEVFRAEDGKPVGEPMISTTTQAYGDLAFELPPDSQGSFLVRLNKNGYATIERVIELSPDEPIPFVDVRASGDFRLEGRIRDAAEQNPIADARVTASDGCATWRDSSDERGRFTLQNLPPQKLTLKIEAEGFATVRREIAPTTPAEPIEIWLEAGWTAAIRVVGPLGAPIPEVTVEMLTEKRDSLYTEITDEKGEATFIGLDPEVSLLQMRFTHFALPRSDEFEYELVRSGKELQVREEFEVELAGRIKGVVRNAATGEPIYSARVMAGEYIGHNMPRSWADPEGKYTLASLTPGTVVLTVHHADYAPVLQETEIDSGQTKIVDFSLVPGRTIRGQVVDEDGNLLAGAHVQVTLWRDYQTAGLIALTDEQGRFVLDHAPEDPLGLAASKPQYRSQEKEIKDETEVRLELTRFTPGAGPAAPAAKYKIGDTIPDASFETLDGRKMSLSELRGKIVLLDFWATWCGPCVAEVPNLKNMHAKYGGRDDFVIIGISLDRAKSRLADFTKEQKIAWPQVFDGKGWDAELARALGIHAIPAMFLVDKDGKIAAVNLTGDALNTEIEKLVK